METIDNSYRIIELEASNFQKLQIVKIVPEDGSIVLKGKNAQGKSSVLDAITATLTGKTVAEPIRDAQGEARIKINLGELVIERVWTSKGTYLTVKSAAGAVYPSPQAMLNKLVGVLSFDPSQFMEMDEKKQVQVLKDLTGLDFSDIDAKRKMKYDERTAINRQITETQGQIAGIPDVNAPDVEVSIAALSTEYQRRVDVNAVNDEKREQYADFQDVCKRNTDERDALIARMAEMQAALDNINKTITANQRALATKEEEIAALSDLSLTDITQQMQTAEETNRLVRQRIQRNELSDKMKKLDGVSNALTDEIAKLDQLKQEKLKATKMPIDNLSFDDTGVRFNGKPIAKASDGEKLMIGLSIALALNPKIRVILMRKGSFLDEDNLKAAMEIAGKNNAQLWIERVGTAGMGILIEDGRIA